MEINRSAPAVGEHEIQVQADPDTVWQTLAGIADCPSWNPDVRSMTFDGPLAPGSGFRWRAGTSLRSKLQVVDRPRELTWTGVTIGMRAVHIYRPPRRTGDAGPYRGVVGRPARPAVPGVHVAVARPRPDERAGTAQG
ncbi:MAG TPA: SRPBCC family protein [Actinomycetota bacterium]|nr:SRPBCC family protein [Actinomycetota bacterium]